MPSYLLVDKNHKVICPQLILPSVDRKAPAQSLTAVEVEQTQWTKTNPNQKDKTTYAYTLTIWAEVPL